MWEVGCWNCGLWNSDCGFRIPESEIIENCFKQINFRKSVTLPIHKKGFEF